ncbi:MAG TPA: organic hydroperoxide resistance protein [Geminicoccaceae bacterium]|nr:organic hydroperoxide resistance protein [Geminicoccaceae bacterium]
MSGQPAAVTPMDMSDGVIPNVPERLKRTRFLDPRSARTRSGGGESMEILYTAVATASGAREGRVRSTDGALDLTLAMPKELGGSGQPGATNPEQLFAAGYAACFESAVRRAARERKVKVVDTTVTARVGIGRRENGRFGLAVKLAVTLPGVERAEAEALVAAAHEEICPYSHATRGNIDVTATVAEAADRR